MRTLVDEQLLIETTEYRLRYTCEHCGHFDDSRQRCSLGYPNRDHLLQRLVRGESLVFCKEFDLV